VTDGSVAGVETGATWRSSERSRNGGVDRVPVEGVPGELWLCGKHLIGPDVERGATVDGAVALVASSRPGAGPEAGPQAHLLRSMADARHATD
jgi:hypothetical protein